MSGAGGSVRGCPPPSYLSLSARLAVNVEAANMVEALGNVIRHRKATVVYKVGDRYDIKTVPVISGEAVRHALQAALADIASSKGLKVCEWCRRHEFIKHGVRPLLGDFEKRLNEAVSKGGLAAGERLVLEECVVEDVGGFLVPVQQPVKRTSVVEVSYMIPALDRDGRLLYGFDVQFHTRHAPSAQQRLQQVAGRREEEQAQSVYNIESSSAVYALSLNVELWRIGVVAASDGCEVLQDRGERVRAALAALAAVLNGDVRVGGHWSSYKPLWRLEGAVAVFSRPMPISAAPAVYYNFIEETKRIAEAKAEIYKQTLGNFEYNVVVMEPDKAADFLKRLVELGVKYAESSPGR
jgi:CRISPR-associated protein Csa2